MNSILDPWSADFWQQVVRLPWSGEVDQHIAPSLFSTSINVRGLGEPKLEQQIFTEVATYGKQLGELTDVVLSLAEAANLADCHALKELKAIARDVDKKKQEYRESAQQRAERALQELADSDPEGLSRLLSSYQ